MKALKGLLPWLAVVIGIALLYDGWIFYSRWSAERAVEQARADEEKRLAGKTLQLVGGSELKINSFYASPGVLKRGASADICYGVVGAKKLKLTPPVEEVWPALNRCIQVKPAKTTEYKLTAEDAGGHSVDAGFVLQVVP